MAKKQDQTNEGVITQTNEEPVTEILTTLVEEPIEESIEEPIEELIEELIEAVTPVQETRQLITDSVVDYRRNRITEKQQALEASQPGVRAIL